MGSGALCRSSETVFWLRTPYRACRSRLPIPSAVADTVRGEVSTRPPQTLVTQTPQRTFLSTIAVPSLAHPAFTHSIRPPCGPPSLRSVSVLRHANLRFASVSAHPSPSPLLLHTSETPSQTPAHHTLLPGPAVGGLAVVVADGRLAARRPGASTDGFCRGFGAGGRRAAWRFA